MKRFSRAGFGFLLISSAIVFGPSALATDPVVTSVRGWQRAGTELVEVYYDLADPDSSSCYVVLQVSADGGTTWNVPVASVSQAVGPGVTTGPGKLILWNAGADWDGQYSNQIRFRVTASDVPRSSYGRVADGEAHGLYIDEDARLWALGENWTGQLGDGTTTDRHGPIQIATGVLQASAGGGHSLFVNTNGSLWAMGENSSGQLGDGTTTDRHSPLQVSVGVIQAAAGADHSLFVKSDRSLWGMGSAWGGQLVDPAVPDYYQDPINLFGAVREVAAGHTHTMIQMLNGSVRMQGMWRPPP